MERQIAYDPEQVAKCRTAGGGVDLDKLERMVRGEPDPAGAAPGPAPAKFAADLEYDDAGAELPGDGLAALGVGHLVGDCTVSNSLGRLLLLQEAKSVFLAPPEAGTVAPTLVETARAFYILAKGPAAFGRLMAAQRFEARLEQLERLSEKTPQHLEVFLAAVERACIAQADWDQEAMSYFEQHTAGYKYPELVEQIAAAIRSGVDSLSKLPRRLVIS